MIEIERIDPAKLIYVPNGIPPLPLPERPAIREELSIPADAPVIGAICVLRDQKASTCWSARSAEVRERFPEVRVLIVGDGPLREELERLRARARPGGHRPLPRQPRRRPGAARELRHRGPVVRLRGGAPGDHGVHGRGPADRRHPRRRRPRPDRGRAQRAAGRAALAAGRTGRGPHPAPRTTRRPPPGMGAAARGASGRSSRSWPPPSGWVALRAPLRGLGRSLIALGELRARDRQHRRAGAQQHPEDLVEGSRQEEVRDVEGDDRDRQRPGVDLHLRVARRRQTSAPPGSRRRSGSRAPPGTGSRRSTPARRAPADRRCEHPAARRSPRRFVCSAPAPMTRSGSSWRGSCPARPRRTGSSSNIRQPTSHSDRRPSSGSTSPDVVCRDPLLDALRREGDEHQKGRERGRAGRGRSACRLALPANATVAIRATAERQHAASRAGDDERRHEQRTAPRPRSGGRGKPDGRRSRSRRRWSGPRPGTRRPRSRRRRVLVSRITAGSTSGL